MHATVRRLLEFCGVLGIVAVLLVTFGRGSPTSTSAAEIDGVWVDTSNRAAVVAVYEAEFESSDPALAWAGDHDGCESGVSSASHREATLRRVNFYRAMAGVPAVVTEDPAYSAKAQDAAMMMSAQGELTHAPSHDFACFTETGSDAAANSNLYLGRTGRWAIDGYIEDPGEGNVDVGHRSTILHPPTEKMGVGDVDRVEGSHSANALWVFDDRVFNEGVRSDDLAVMREPARYIAWPPRGYVPAEIVYPRWSFTKADVDVTGAKVRVFELGGPTGPVEVPLEVVDRGGEPGHVPLPTIVWEPEIRPDGVTDTPYLVFITDVIPTSVPAEGAIESPTSYSYTVQLLGTHPNHELTPAQFLAKVDHTTSE